MTGLDVDQDRITEVGIIVTDFDFNELDTYEAIVKQEESVLERMKNSPWYDWSSGQRETKGTIYDMATASGLLEKIRNGQEESAVEDEVVQLVNKNFDQRVILAGNSIHNDRRFIVKWWPKLEALLHYRMVDVTSFKVMMQGTGRKEFVKPENHRALEDIRGSIEELQYYLKKLAEKA